MKRNSLDLLACPACHAPLTLHDGTAGPLESGRLRCERCQKDYPIEQGIRQVLLDGNPLPGSLIPLVEDGQPHEVWVVMG